MAQELDLSEFGGTPELDLSEFFGAEVKTEKPEQGFISTLGSELWQGAKSAGRSVLATGNAAVGDLPDVELLAKAQDADRANDAKEKTALLAEIERRKQANPEAGWTDAVKDVAGAAWDNKTGTAQMVASQLPNSAVALGGAWAGGKAGAAAGAALGSVVPGVGTAIGGVAGGILGGLTGMFLGNFALETGGKAMEKAGDGFTQQEADDSLIEGAKKAAVITGVDAATFGAGRLATRAFVAPAVRAGARAEAKVLVDAGVDITNGASIAAALANTELRTAAKAAGEAAAKAASSATRRAGNAATGLTMETVSEGVGEYYGEEVATGNGDVYDAALESISSLSQSAFQTARAMRESGVQGLDPGEILKVQLNESAAKPGSVLSRATVAANPELKIEPEPVIETPVQPTPIDPALAQRLAEAGQGATFDGLPAGETSPLLNELADDGNTDGIPPGDPVGTGLPPDQPAAGLGAEPGPVGESGLNQERPPADAVVPPAGLSIDTAAPAVAPIAGDQINKTWTEFHPASGTLNIPRKEMPQVKSEHRGAMTNFLAARGVTGAAETVEASSLKPTQREFSPDKVKQALNFKGSDRPILVSSDGHILDGHHQWMAKAQQEAPVKITRLSAPIAELLTAMKEFPSAGMTKDAEPFSQPQGKTNEPQATQALEATQEGQEAPAAKLKLVLAPQNVAAEPVSPANPGNALVRLRRAQVQRMAKSGFTQLVNQDGQTLMVNPTRNEAMVITGGPVAVALAQRAIAAEAPAGDNVALGQTNGRVSGATETATQGAANTSTGAGDRGVAGVDQDLYGDLRNAAPGSLHERGRTLQNPQADADAVTALSAAAGYQIPLADPASPVTQALDKLLDVMAGLTGVRGIAISDKSKQADDGLAMPGLGRFFVNTDRPQMHVGRTISHEFKHLTEKNPGLKALYDRMYDLIPTEAKAAYFKKYLFAGQDMARANPKQLQALKDEMMADFMGQRFNDRAWLESLAKQKPGLFAQFIKEWIPLLDKLITELKGLIKPTKKLAQKDIDTLMQGYVKELEAMKAMAMEVAEAWATNNPSLAAKSSVNAVIQHAKRAGPDQWRPRDNFLVPEIDGAFEGDTGNIVTLAGFSVTNKSGRSLAFPPMPVRISIGQHDVGPQDQFGVQHRLDNATEKRLSRDFITPDLGTDGAAIVERAARDMATSVLQAALVFPDKNFTDKVVLWGGGQSVVLQKTKDAQGQNYWSVKTVIPQTMERAKQENGNPAPIKGSILDGVEPQQFNAIKTRILSKLREPVLGLSSSDSYTVSDAGLIVNGQTNETVPTVVAAPKKTLARDENGKIILNKNKVQLSLRDELQAELDAEMDGVDGKTASDQTEFHSLHAEEAFPELYWEKKPGGLLVAKIPELYAKDKTATIQIEPEGNGLYSGMMRGTWVGPANTESDGYATLDGIKAFVHRFVASKELRDQGFDLLSTVTPKEKSTLVKAWKKLNQAPGVRRYGDSEPNLSMLEIAKKLGITLNHSVKVTTDDISPENRIINVEFTSLVREHLGEKQRASLELNTDGDRWLGTADTSSLNRGGMGAAAYQLFAEYALDNGITITPDHSLSGVNTYRRTEQMLSAAMRAGASNVMVPHPTQRIYGFQDDARTTKQHDDNLARLLLAGLRNVQELVPDLSSLTYDPVAGNFFDEGGQLAEEDISEITQETDARAFGLGRSTLARAVLTQMILNGNKIKAHSFKLPVLYSARDSEADQEVQLSLEYKPGVTTGLLKKMNTEMDSSDQKSYLIAMRDALRSNVPSVQELLGWGRKRYSEVIDGGAWKALSGWSIQSTLSLPNGILDEQTRNEINFFLATNGMWTGQEGMAWHLPKFGDKGLGVEFNLGGKKLSAAQFEEVYASVMHEFKNYSIPPIPSKDGLRFLNYTGLPQDEFIYKLKYALVQTSVAKIWKDTYEQQTANQGTAGDIRSDDKIDSRLRQGSSDLQGEPGNDDLGAFTADGIRVFSHDGDLIENNWRQGEGQYRELIVKSWEALKDLPGSRMPKTLEALNQYLATQQENADGVNQFFDDEFDLGKPSLSKEERATGVKERVEFPARTMFQTARTKSAFFKNPDDTLMVLYHGGAPLGNLEQRDGISLFASTDPNYANRAAKFSAEWGETPESVVYPVTLTVARPFDWRIAGHRDSITMTAYPADFPKGKFKAALKAGKFDLLESREFIQAAKAAGYDAVLVRDDSSFSGFLNVGVFNARDVAFAMEPDLGDTLRYSKRDGINPKVLEAIPEIAKLAAYLTPTEKSKLRVDTAQKMVDLHKALPSSDEMAAVAYAGKAKRFWYRNSLSAIAHVFGQDGWRFTGLLAATSPQCSVETNLLNALNTWKNWVAAGRPTDKAAIVAVMGRSVQGNKGEDSVLNAWVNNAVSALSAKDFAELVLSGPKVDSFMRNLLGHYYEVTNDAWIANYTLMDQKIFSGSKNKAGTEPGKGPGYLAMNAQTRKAAKKLGWQPAEVQETVWSWAMSMLETMDKQGETRGSKELLAEGAMTDELINRTPDFRSLFHLPVYANILEQAGYHDALANLVAPHTVEDHGPMPFDKAKTDKLLHQAGLRLEFLQRQRRTNVQLSWEARPGESTGILPGIHAAPIELQQQYMADIYAAVESSGFYDKTGLSLRNTLFGPGAWQGKVLPGAQSLTRPGVVADNKGGLMVDPESRTKINVAASVLGTVLNQEGVYWHYPIYRNGNEEFDNGVEINFGRSLTNDEMSRLYGAIIKKSGHTDWAPANTPTGVRVLNFSETANKSFHKTIQSALKQFEKKFDGDASAKTFSSDGDALENNWKESTNGQDYLARISQAGRSDLLGWISDVLQPAIDQINRRYSDEHGWGAPTRGDIQRSARESGPGDRRRPGDATTVRAAIHFGQRAGLNQLSALSNGTGIRGAEDLRLKESTDPRIKRRSYFYSPVAGGIPQPESGLGGNVYQADLDNLYDPSVATELLQGSGNTFESLVLDSGYDGYLDPSSGVIVMLDRDVPVKQIGNVGDFKLVQRVAKQITPKTMTTVNGNDLSRKPAPAELMGLIKNKAAIEKAAPTFRFEYGFVKVGKEHAADFDQAMAALNSTFRLGELQRSARDVDPAERRRKSVDALRRMVKCLS